MIQMKYIKRMSELIGPVDQQILMCDDRQDLLMFACVMLQRVTEILDHDILVVKVRNMILLENTKVDKYKGIIMFSLDLNEVKEFIAKQSPQTKIYIGCDSERILIGEKVVCGLHSCNCSSYRW
jgi:hypothetical protein